MFFYFSKLIQPILWPFNIALIALVVGLYAVRKDNRRVALWALSISLIALVLPGMPIVARGLLYSIESTYPVVHHKDAPKADVIAILGGSMMGQQAPRKESEEGNGSRVLPGARLYRAGKAPYIIVSSGMSYSLLDRNPRSESEDMRDVLVEMGVPPSRILMESRSRNTDENARYVAELMKQRGFRSVLVVTSASHLPRAMSSFKKYGVTQAHPFPTDHRIFEKCDGFFSIVPDMASLELSRTAIREYVGRWVYQ